MIVEEKMPFPLPIARVPDVEAGKWIKYKGKIYKLLCWWVKNGYNCVLVGAALKDIRGNIIHIPQSIIWDSYIDEECSNG